MRTTRNHVISFWQCIGFIVAVLLVFGVGRLTWYSLSSAGQWIVVSIIVISAVIWLVRKSADDANLTVWSWLRQLIR